jgi:hypothetical protein
MSIGNRTIEPAVLATRFLEKQVNLFFVKSVHSFKSSVVVFAGLVMRFGFVAP